MISKKTDIILAAKCSPCARTFEYIQKAGIGALELYLSKEVMSEPKKIVRLCKDFPFRYCLHAPDDHYGIKELAYLTESLKAEVVVFHDIYWEDEWSRILALFKGAAVKLCMENTSCVNESLKFMRRFSLHRCLDLEHLQQECAGVYKEAFLRQMGQSSHIHLTGYSYGSCLWHSHIHHSPKHNLYLLNMLKDSGYRGFVVSEAKKELQTPAEFKKLNKFFKNWQER